MEIMSLIWQGVSSVFNILNTPLDIFGGLSLFIILMSVFVMGIIINIVIAFVNNDFGSNNLREARRNAQNKKTR